MKIALVVWEEFPDKITYSVGFFVRENKEELFIAGDYAAGEYEGVIPIPIKRIRKRRVFTTRRHK